MKLNTLVATLTVASAFALQAQNPPPSGTVHNRRENQQDRIANGISSGQLTAGETATLEKKEAALNKEIATDRAANGGKLTNQEKVQINRQQNKLSNQIYQDKHNSTTAHYGANEVDARRANQQARIAQGVRSGQLTAGETARLEGQQSKINKEVRTERAANGGKLTPAEHQQVNAQQNRQSASIFTKKHNGKTGPK